MSSGVGFECFQTYMSYVMLCNDGRIRAGFIIHIYNFWYTNVIHTVHRYMYFNKLKLEI